MESWVSRSVRVSLVTTNFKGFAPQSCCTVRWVLGKAVPTVYPTMSKGASSWRSTLAQIPHSPGLLSRLRLMPKVLPAMVLTSCPVRVRLLSSEGARRICGAWGRESRSIASDTERVPKALGAEKD